ITYFYAGVAKINADWLLDAAPLRWALREPHVAGKLKPWFSPTHFDWIQTVIHHVGTAYFLSYAGLLFDLSIGVLFLIRRTRFLAFVLMALFHATNHFVIYDNIDWFPLLGITSALIFLNPDWPEKFRAWLHSPRWAQPDWPWFGTGFIVIPVFGAALGWKSRAAFSSLKCDLRPSIHSYTPFLVAAWLVWQGLFPLRHYFIAGDARITGEGLSFSWRLKTDDHFAQAAQIYVQDAAIVPRDWKPGSRINWNEFGEEKVIYSKITPGRINWKQLPEIVVTIEPMMGERIFFNPFSVSSAAITERDARDRVRQIWHEAYGREPRFIGATAPVAPVIDSLSDALRQGGAVAEAAQMTLFSSRAKQYNSPLADPQSERRNRGNVFAALRNLCARDSSGAIIPILRRLNPFALQGENQVSLPFLLIEDPALFYTAPEERFRLNQALWKTPLRNGPGSGPPEAMSAEQPRIIYTADVGNEINSLYPQACVFDALERPEMPPQIRWNSLKDCSPSKFDHISNQPFYLRRYARRIASLWEHKYGRRPIVTAETSVSINHRPYQPIVNPDADLAAVSQKWFRHNDWIRDLETPRIPRDALAATRR
ncbi:MAG: Vitamin K-dependent gamma-carboxylase, partial [Verrucomicrobiales bacterium]|nr:Vitamin K-dependent gamma-carboxylase [Verrucomicrobiales bacterium]